MICGKSNASLGGGMADAPDLKSDGRNGRMGSTPIPGTLWNGRILIIDGLWFMEYKGNGSAARASRGHPIQFQQMETGHGLPGTHGRKPG